MHDVIVKSWVCSRAAKRYKTALNLLMYARAFTPGEDAGFIMSRCPSLAPLFIRSMDDAENIIKRYPHLDARKIKAYGTYLIAIEFKDAHNRLQFATYVGSAIGSTLQRRHAAHVACFACAAGAHFADGTIYEAVNKQPSLYMKKIVRKEHIVLSMCPRGVSADAAVEWLEDHFPVLSSTSRGLGELGAEACSTEEGRTAYILRQVLAYDEIVFACCFRHSQLASCSAVESFTMACAWCTTSPWRCAACCRAGVLWMLRQATYGPHCPITGLPFDRTGGPHHPLAATLIAHRDHRRRLFEGTEGLDLATMDAAGLETFASSNAVVQSWMINRLIRSYPISILLVILQHSSARAVARVDVVEQLLYNTGARKEGAPALQYGGGEGGESDGFESTTSCT